MNNLNQTIIKEVFRNIKINKKHINTNIKAIRLHTYIDNIIMNISDGLNKIENIYRKMFDIYFKDSIIRNPYSIFIKPITRFIKKGFNQL